MTAHSGWAQAVRQLQQDVLEKHRRRASSTTRLHIFTAARLLVSSRLVSSRPGVETSMNYVSLYFRDNSTPRFVVRSFECRKKN